MLELTGPRGTVISSGHMLWTMQGSSSTSERSAHGVLSLLLNYYGETKQNTIINDKHHFC